MTELAPLEDALGHRFADPQLPVAALTHRSWAHEQGEEEEHYERLEFLGDAVLGLVASEWLYRRHPARREGHLSRLKSYLVSAEVLADHARRLGLGERLRLGVGEERSGGRTKPSLLADALEALIGAVYLDAGLDAARRVIAPFLEAAAARSGRLERPDAKTRLQELAQGRGWSLPVYDLVAEEGPDHRKSFVVDCRIDGAVRGRARGSSKKEAEQRAAAAALAELDLGGGGG